MRPSFIPKNIHWLRTYLDMSDDTEDNLDSTNRGTNLSMSVFKIQINPPAIE